VGLGLEMLTRLAPLFSLVWTAFSAGVEMLNIKTRRNKEATTVHLSKKISDVDVV
jgi:hypothetical protein